jgi:ATP/maltotriose-dependent transcriptional regulator MalT
MQRRNMPGEAVLCGPRLLPLLELARQEGRHADLAARALAALEGEERGGSILLQNGQSLTPREAEVLQLLVQGASNQDIADKLVISLRTAKAHVSSILSKLQVSTRSEAIARSHELALLSSPRSR